MGNERRSDSDLDVAHRPRVDATAGHDHDDEHVDPAFARRQIEARSWESRPVFEAPDGYVRGAGDPAKLEAELDAALAASDGTKLVEIVSRMSRAGRAAVRSKLPDLMRLLGGGEALRLADMLQADIAETIDAALGMATPPSSHQMRAYLTDVHPARLYPFLDEGRRQRFGRAYPGSIANVIPQILDDAVFSDYSRLTGWWIETTPPAVVARTLLMSTQANVWKRIAALDQTGPQAWAWALAVDDAMVIAAQPDIAETFQRQAPAGDLQQALAVRVAARAAGPSANASVAKDLRAHRKQHLASDSVETLATEARAGGLSFDDQVSLMLAKPGATVDDVRLGFAGLTTDSGGLTVSGLLKLAARFPASTPADVFGFVPDQVYQLALDHKALRPWLVDKAEPIEVLRFVTRKPDRIAELCRWLVAHGTGYDWVYRLGGGIDDHLLRRFVIECPDLNVADWIKNHVLADNVKPGGHEIGSAPIDPRAYQSTAATLKDDLVRPTAEAQDVAADVDALTDAEVATLRTDAPRLKTLFERVGKDHAMRVVARLQPRLRDVLNFVPEGSVGLVEWIGTRGRDDLIEGFAHLAAADRARKLLPALGLLELAPQLEQSELLAEILLRNPGLIGWVMRSEAVAAITALGAPVCAVATVRALEGHGKLVEHWPPGKVLPAPARTALARLAGQAHGDLHDRLAHKLDERGTDPDLDQPTQKETNVRLMQDTATTTLVESLEDAFDDKPSAEVVLRICRAHRSEAAALLNDAALLEKVRSLIPLSPERVFLEVPYSTLLGVQAGALWLFQTAPPHDLLRAAVTEPDIRVALVKTLNHGLRAAEDWCRALPRGKALSPAEKATLHKLTVGLTNIDAHMLLLGARYDFEVTGSLSGPAIDRIWTTLERVPESHISDGVVRHLHSFGAGLAPTVAGEYSETMMQVSDGMLDQGGQLTGDRSGANAKVLMTKQEAMDNLGLDEQTFAQWLADGRLSKDAGSGLFRIGYHVERDVLSATVLHELGHGVHHMIGNKSELIFDLVGWKAYTEADFDGWATELGGWDRVRADDQREIREVWMMWLSSSRGDQARESVGDMVRADHPAVSKAYAGVGIVDVARKKSMASRLDPYLFGDRAAFVSHKQQRWYTIGQRGLLSAPGDYALTAPGEYFAECYMQYYRDYDGKDPKTKGYRLAPWIKKWFDENVDNTTHNPRAGDDFSGDA